MNYDVLKTGGTYESCQFVGIGQTKWRAHDRRCLTNVSLQRFRQYGKSGTFVYAAPHHQRKPSLHTKNATHFAQCRGPISEELQAQLAIHNVE